MPGIARRRSRWGIEDKAGISHIYHAVPTGLGASDGDVEKIEQIEESLYRKGFGANDIAIANRSLLC